MELSPEGHPVYSIHDRAQSSKATEVEPLAFE